MAKTGHGCHSLPSMQIVEALAFTPAKLRCNLKNPSPHLRFFLQGATAHALELPCKMRPTYQSSPLGLSLSCFAGKASI